MLSANLQAAFSINNIERAWRWTRTNPNGEYRRYFRHIYSAYAIAVPEALSHLRRRLLDQTYDPGFATKVYFPKTSGILRPYSLLSIEDQIVYQSFVNIVAERLYRRTKKRYLHTVFGNLYNGKKSVFFYQDWRRGYRAFSRAIRSIVAEGYHYAASFDLTACYDSIDHKVLTHFLLDLGLEREFSSTLATYLSRWTVASNEKPIYLGHGIPQGPLASGLLSEVVLRHFDEEKKNRRVLRYFRYVDDIRLFSTSEGELRAELVRLDKKSKEIGLFPQTAKIHIHKVNNVEEEVKSISQPPEWEAMSYDPDQRAIRARLMTLTARNEIKNETRFKFVLGRATYHGEIAKKLLKIVQKRP